MRLIRYRIWTNGRSVPNTLTSKISENPRILKGIKRHDITLTASSLIRLVFLRTLKVDEGNILLSQNVAQNEME